MILLLSKFARRLVCIGVSALDVTVRHLDAAWLEGDSMSSFVREHEVTKVKQSPVIRRLKEALKPEKSLGISEKSCRGKREPRRFLNATNLCLPLAIETKIECASLFCSLSVFFTSTHLPLSSLSHQSQWPTVILQKSSSETCDRHSQCAKQLNNNDVLHRND